MVMHCLLVCEGGLDTPLASHIQLLLGGHGYREVDFNISIDGRRLVDKVRNGLGMAPYYDLIFVHRDADRAGPDARYREIVAAVQEAGYGGLWVGIVPVRMTEAWLILQEATIRNAVQKPRGRTDLNLPTPATVERMADPKAALDTALLNASGERGRRRRGVQRLLPDLRNRLLANLPVGGPLEQVPSWTRFRDDTVAALQAMRG